MVLDHSRRELKQAYGKKRVKVIGSFAPAGTGAPTDLRGKGVSSVTRTGVGAFRLTFQDSFPSMIDCKVGMQMAVAGPEQAQHSTYNATNKTLDISIWDTNAAAVTDVSANANNRVNFNITFANTDLG